MRSDADLLEAWRNGDKQAGSELFDRYFDAVHRFFRSKVDEGSEDLVQQTFLALVSHRDALEKGSSFRTYLFVVARNKLYSHFRSRARREDKVDFGVTSVIDLGASPSKVVAGQQERTLLVQALRRVPLETQCLLEFYYVERMTAPELAQVMNLPEGTIRSRLRRGLERLRKEMERIAENKEQLETTASDLDAWAQALPRDEEPKS